MGPIVIGCAGPAQKRHYPRTPSLPGVGCSNLKLKPASNGPYGLESPILERRGAHLHLTEQNEILRVENLKKVFRSGVSELVLFENLSFQVQRGEMLAIVGESGAGKSTLLHILG